MGLVRRPPFPSESWVHGSASDGACPVSIPAGALSLLIIASLIGATLIAELSGALGLIKATKQLIVYGLFARAAAHGGGRLDEPVASRRHPSWRFGSA